MAATALVAARMEPELKERAHAVLVRAHLTETQVIRNLFEHIVYEDRVPDIVLTSCAIEYEGESPRPHPFADLLDFMENGPLSAYDWTGLDEDSLDETLSEREYR